MVATPLPDLDTLDLEAAKAFLIEQHSRYTAALTFNSSEIERLVLLVEKLQRMLFGSKSEKVLRQIDQLELQLEELQAASAIEESRAAAEAEHPTQVRPFRRPLPEHLPREVHRHLPGHEACPDCGGRLSQLGEDVAEMLEYVRASFKVLRHVRPRLSCDACDRIAQAHAASSTRSTSPILHLLQAKLSNESPRSMPSKQRSVAAGQRSGSPSAKPGQDLLSIA